MKKKSVNTLLKKIFCFVNTYFLNCGTFFWKKEMDSSGTSKITEILANFGNSWN